MKHRSVIAFILLAAALFAAPQISSDLSALKSALGARIRGEILHAVLNLRADDAASELVARPADALLASHQAKANACTLTQPAAKKSNAQAQAQPRAGAAPKSGASEQFAMLIDPKSGMDIASDARANAGERIIIGEAEMLAEGEIAMLGAPDSGVELPPMAKALLSGSNEKDSEKRWQKSAEKQIRMAYVAGGLEKIDAQKFAEETLRRLGTTLNGADAAGENGARFKLLKVRSERKGAAGSSKSSAPQPSRVNAPQPVPVAALIPPDLAPLPPGCATAGE